MSDKTIPGYLPQKHWVDNNDAVGTDRHPDVFTETRSGKVLHFEHSPSRLLISTDTGIQISIQAYRDDILRVRYAKGAFAPDFSYALQPGLQAKPDALEVKEEEDRIVFRTSQLAGHVLKANGKLHFEDAQTGDPILADGESYLERSTILEGTNHLQVSFAAPRGEVYFGLGDKSWHLDLRGRAFQNWNSDAFGFWLESDPLYRSIPFYYGVYGSQAYGIFVHNSARTHFDFDSQSDGITRIWAATGEMDYFFMYGPQPDQVAQAYHYLTGTPELPALWTLGFHQCRWSYYPEARVKEVADTFRELNIPCDAIYLDIDYMDGYRCFTWNKEHFPDPAALTGYLKAQGFKTIVMIDPGIRVDDDYSVYKEGKAAGYFCKRTSGETMIGPVWPQQAVWPDYTHPDVRNWWGQLYKDLYTTDGVAGFWNDMNEPAVFKVHHLTFPDDVLHHHDGYPCNHRLAHNIYGQQMARATQEGLKNIQPDVRPFVLSRATFSGGQRHAAIWTGDNVASWEHLQLANRQCQRLSISGFSMVGTDIGGFVDTPTPELFVRWLQLGVFHPLYRVHSMGNNVDGAAEVDAESVQAAEANNRQDQEPWSFGEPYTSQAREAIEFRYKLLPYLYTALYKHTQTGLPVLRSLSFADPGDALAQRRENEFLFGHDLLVNPVTSAGASQWRTYLPTGQWLDYHTGKSHLGRRFAQMPVDANTIPMYAAAGAVIPNYPVQQHVGEATIDVVELRVYHGNSQHTSYLYQDAGDGYAYKKGQFRLSSFTTQGSTKHLQIAQHLAGDYKSDCEVYEIKCFGLPFQPQSLWIDGVAIQVIDEEEHAWVVVAPADFKTLELRA